MVTPLRRLPLKKAKKKVEPQPSEPTMGSSKARAAPKPPNGTDMAGAILYVLVFAKAECEPRTFEAKADALAARGCGALGGKLMGAVGSTRVRRVG